MEEIHSDDEWFYESINRYDVLQMYDLRLQPLFIKKLPENVLCITGYHDIQKNEIMTIKLPMKLTASVDQRQRLKNKDFDIISSGFFDDEILGVESLHDGKIVVVLFKKNGLSLLDLSPENLEITSKENILQDLGRNINFDVSKHRPEMLVIRQADDDIIRFDFATRKKLYVPYPSALSELEGNVFCSYMGPDEVVLMNESTGSLALLDLKSDTSIPIAGPNHSNRSSYVMNFKDYKIASLSLSGWINVYDTRQRKVLCNGQVDVDKVSKSRPKIRLGLGDKLSVSGFGGGVVIYSILGDSCCEVFRHRGHEIDVDENVFVTDHLWLDHIHEDFIVSCANNGSMNCWQFLLNS